MNKIEKCKPASRQRANVIFLAMLFILAGLAIFAHKQGALDGRIYDVAISWQMLLIVFGLWHFVRRQWSGGVLMAGLGAFFLIPVALGAGPGWIAGYWPLLLVIVGLLIIMGMFRRCGKRTENRCGDSTSYDTVDGYVVSENTLGGVKHIVLDPVFKGARIRNTLGGTVLDLRHTSLEEGETYIDVECTFGGVELFVPRAWKIVTKIQPVLAGVEDKRFGHNEERDPARKLVLRGHITFGGVEIKD